MHKVSKWLRDFAITMTCEMVKAETRQVYKNAIDLFHAELRILEDGAFNPFEDDDEIEPPMPEPLSHYSFSQAKKILDDALVIVPESARNVELFSMSTQLLAACGLPESLVGNYMEAHGLGTVSSCDRAEMRCIFNRCLYILQRTVTQFNAEGSDPEEWSSRAPYLCRGGFAQNEILGNNAAWPL